MAAAAGHLDQAQLGDVAADRSLGDHQSTCGELADELGLALERSPADQLANDALAGRPAGLRSLGAACRPFGGAGVSAPSEAAVPSLGGHAITPAGAPTMRVP